MAQTLTAQISVQFNLARQNYFWLVEQRSKSEVSLLAFYWHINPTIPQRFAETGNNRPPICGFSKDLLTQNDFHPVLYQ